MKRVLRSRSTRDSDYEDEVIPGRVSFAATPTTFDDAAASFLRYYDTVGGKIRRDVVRANLDGYLRDAPCRVLDIGCGEGLDALWYASRGYHVTAIDSSGTMLERATAAAQRLPERARRRVSFHSIDDGAAAQLLRTHYYDVVLCHGVLMYQDKERAFLRRVCRFVRPGGILSLLTRNADALAYRAAAEHRYEEAIALLGGQDLSRGRLGIESRAHSVEQLTAVLAQDNMDIEGWFGVKIFSDVLDQPLDEEGIRLLLNLEATASRREPYRRTGRLIHLIARSRDSTDQQG